MTVIVDINGFLFFKRPTSFTKNDLYRSSSIHHDSSDTHILLNNLFFQCASLFYLKRRRRKKEKRNLKDSVLSVSSHNYMKDMFSTSGQDKYVEVLLKHFANKKTLHLYAYSVNGLKDRM